jgi:acid phosphatase
MGDITARMTGSIERNGSDGMLEVGGTDGKLGRGRSGETDIKFAMSGCHDTTLAAALVSLGAFENEKWPPFTSHIAFEMFKKRGSLPAQTSTPLQPSPTWWSSIFGAAKTPSPASSGIARKPMSELTPAQRESLNEYYVRIRYNDKIMSVPGCAAQGKHLDGDTTFCTLEAFKGIVDKYTPKNWKAACGAKLDEPIVLGEVERAGY